MPSLNTAPDAVPNAGEIISDKTETADVKSQEDIYKFSANPALSKTASRVGQSSGSISKGNSPTTPQPVGLFTLKDVATLIFQTITLIAALVFGAWAIKSYNTQLQANTLTSQANANSDASSMLQSQYSLWLYCKTSQVNISLGNALLSSDQVF